MNKNEKARAARRSARELAGKPVWKDDLGRFMAHVHMVPESGCWIFSLVGTWGYGQFTIGPKTQRQTLRAHRWSYEHFVSPIPEDMVVCHRCDVPCCVNPKHLFLGTTIDNVRDRVRKDRSAKGESHGARKRMRRSEHVHA